MEFKACEGGRRRRRFGRVMYDARAAKREDGESERPSSIEQSTDQIRSEE